MVNWGMHKELYFLRVLVEQLETLFVQCHSLQHYQKCSYSIGQAVYQLIQGRISCSVLNCRIRMWLEINVLQHRFSCFFDLLVCVHSFCTHFPFVMPANYVTSYFPATSGQEFTLSVTLNQSEPFSERKHYNSLAYTPLKTKGKTFCVHARTSARTHTYTHTNQITTIRPQLDLKKCKILPISG